MSLNLVLDFMSKVQYSKKLYRTDKRSLAWLFKLYELVLESVNVACVCIYHFI